MNYAIVLAGGVGSRMGAGMPKQFIEINGKPILAITLEKFSKCKEIDGIVVVSVDISKTKEIINKYDIKKVIGVVDGGDTRRQSSLKGCQKLQELGANEDDVAIIHDGARPFVTEKTILENIQTVKVYGACETAIPIYDSVIRADNEGNVGSFVERNGLYRVQTPQGFSLGLILKAHEYVEKLDEREKSKITDDSGLVMALGEKVKIVEGTSENVKITTKSDLVLFEKQIESCYN